MRARISHYLAGQLAVGWLCAAMPSIVPAAEGTDAVTVQFPSGERVVGHIVDQNETRIVIESAVLGRVTASPVGIVVTPPGANTPAAPPAALPVASRPAPAALAGLMGEPAGASAGWPDVLAGWHGLLSVGWQFEHRTENSDRVIGFGEAAKAVGKTEVRLSGLYIAQSSADVQEIDHLELGLRLRQGFGERWTLQNETTWTRDPTADELRQIVSGLSLNYHLWKGPRGGFQAGPGVMWTDTRFDGLLGWRWRKVGWGGQAGLHLLPYSWLLLESAATAARFDDVALGHDLRLLSVKSRALMVTVKPWTVGLRHELNRIELIGLPAYKESLLWLEFGHQF